MFSSAIPCIGELAAASGRSNPLVADTCLLDSFTDSMQLPRKLLASCASRAAQGDEYMADCSPRECLASGNPGERTAEGRKFRGKAFHAGDSRVDFLRGRRCNRIASAINYCRGKKRGWNLGREGACLLGTVGNKSVRIREEISTGV